MPRRYISNATKAKAVADWKSGKKTAKQIQTELKITSGMLSAWGRERDTLEHEPAPETPPEVVVAAPVVASTDGDGEPKRQRANPEVKERAVAEYRKGRPAREVGAEFGVSDATIYAWSNQLKKKEKKQGGSATGVLSQLTPSAAGMDAGLMLLRKALDRMHVIQCPSCNHTFKAQPPGYTENLVTLAAHLLSGEEP